MIKYLVTFLRGLLIVGWVILAMGVILCILVAPIIVIDNPKMDYIWIFYLLTGVDFLIVLYAIYKIGDSWIDK